MSAVIIIPARYASTRLPAKPLLKETGKFLIQHVVENVRNTPDISRVVVATDDKRIFDAVESFGADVVMTRADHTSGTDRLAETASLLGLADDDIVINVQGDEPNMPPAVITVLLNLLKNCDAPMATLCTPLSPQAAADPNKVKVVFDQHNYALYFSRAKIPFDRDGHAAAEYFLHMGIYAYRVSFLKKFTSLPQTKLEKTEKLEQLRALENGYRIRIAAVDYHGVGIDTPQDYAEFVASRRK